MKHSHYKKDVSHLQFIDPYRIAELYGVGGGPLEHAHKKILCAGIRGAKDKAKDIQEAIDSLRRWQEMQAEDARSEISAKTDESARQYMNCEVAMCAKCGDSYPIELMEGHDRSCAL